MVFSTSISNTGNMTSGVLDEVTINPSSYGSLEFSGGTDYLTTPSNAAFAFATGNFTLEAWVYRTGNNPVNSTNTQNIFDFRTAEPQAAINLGYDGGTNKIYYYINGTYYLVSTTSISLYTWYHVAVVRSGSTATLYINGTAEASYTTTINATQTTCWIGGRFAAVSGDYRSWQGYISNVRIVKGTAVYTGNFTPSNIPLTAISNTSLLLNTPYPYSGINYLQDSSTNAFTLTNNGVTSNTINPFPVTNGVSVSKLLSTGNLQVAGIYNEAVANGLPVIDSSLIMWLDPSVLLGAQSYVQGDTVMKSLTDANTVNTSYPTVSLNGSLPYTLLPTTHQGYFTSSGGGSGGYIRIDSSSASYTCPPLMTACVWAYTADWQSPNNSRIMSCTDAGGWSISFSDPGIPAGNIGGQIYAGGYRYVYLPTSAVSAGWHHWAMSWDGRYLKLYLDGVSASSLGYSTGTYDIGSSGNSIGLSGAPLLIFVEPQGSSPIDNRFPGSVGQCLLYNRALSNTEIQTIYNSRAGLYF